MSIVNDHIKDEVVLLLFTEGALPDLESKPNVIRVGSVNSMPYDHVLRLIGSSDYMVFPSICEGFGMPVLEANAMGVPAIHSWFPPLSEFSSKDFNFTFGYHTEHLVNQGNLQYWVFHEYRPELLAEMITHAVRIRKDSRPEYDEYCKKATEHTRDWDYRRIYKRFLKLLKL
jgi:glycosyltransferase involved in cell wall biosynthesis